MDTPSKYLDVLIREFSRLPGIGPKSASRIVFHILSMPDVEAQALSRSIIEVKKNIKTCQICGGISDGDICSICSDQSRNSNMICVVENAKDVLNIEKTGSFEGKYHVLGGVISPLDGIAPDNLNISSLIERCSNGVEEIILATNPTIEGDATSLYISKLIKPLGIKVMRIARGLPVGADLDYTDMATIIKSLDDRLEI